MKPKKPISIALSTLALACMLFSCNENSRQDHTPDASQNPYMMMDFKQLPTQWDEAIPLGNGLLGCLVWQNENRLRLSLDRIDLWDLRQVEEIFPPEHTYQNLYKLWKSGDYKQAQDLREELRKYPYPTKIPGGAIEIDITGWGEEASARLSLAHGITTVSWPGGIEFTAFVNASAPEGWFRIKNAKEGLIPQLIAPDYAGRLTFKDEDDQSRQELKSLGYPEPEIIHKNNTSYYYQQTSLGNSYSILLAWHEDRHQTVTAVWSMQNNPDSISDTELINQLEEAVQKRYTESVENHTADWKDFWSKSMVQIPDSILQKQYLRDIYKFGSVTGISDIPISLQAIWTADNGKLPPWAGDFHHDLNTQLSYWPAYNGNYIEEARIFTDWLWRTKPEGEKYARSFFETEGLAYPGITDIEGRLMPAWWQYTHSIGTPGWLAQNFYWQWRYTMDRQFLETRAYPWFSGVAQFFNNLSVKTASGKRKLPMSSSPEIFDDTEKAWFKETTNYDLAFIRWTLEKAAELAKELNRDEESRMFMEQLNEWPELSISDDHLLLLAPGIPLHISHRHLSHMVPVYPLGMIDPSHGERDKKIIEASLQQLEELGTRQWIGFSFPWYASLWARAKNGEKASETLRIFAENFVSTNSFHINGDQSGKGYSNYRYRPFTLEGNFAFAGAIHEMLIQSHTGTIELFPAIPASWKDVSFKTLRTEGAFLVSAEKQNGKVTRVTVRSLAGAPLKMKNPFAGAEGTLNVEGAPWRAADSQKAVIEIETREGQEIIFSM